MTEASKISAIELKCSILRARLFANSTLSSWCITIPSGDEVIMFWLSRMFFRLVSSRRLLYLLLIANSMKQNVTTKKERPRSSCPVGFASLFTMASADRVGQLMAASVIQGSRFLTTTSMDYTQEIEELLIWFVMFDWWEDNQKG